MSDAKQSETIQSEQEQEKSSLVACGQDADEVVSSASPMSQSAAVASNGRDTEDSTVVKPLEETSDGLHNSHDQEMDASGTNSDQCSVADSERESQLVQEISKLTQELTSEKHKGQVLTESVNQFEGECRALREEVSSLRKELAGQQVRADSAENHLKKKLEQLMQSEGEKDVLMSRLTVLDQEKMKLLDEQVTVERKWRECLKECDRLQSLVKEQQNQLTIVAASSDKNQSLVAEHTKELVKLKEEVNSFTIKLKWAQNKLKAETEAHKETKQTLTVTSKKLTQAKEEGEQIRADLKAMIAQYQDSEEMRSNTLDVKLREKEKELLVQEQEIADQQQLHTLTVKELEITKASLELAQRECQQQKSRVSELTTQITEKQADLDKLRSSVDLQKKEHKKLEGEISSMVDMNKDIEIERHCYAALKENHSQLQKKFQHLEKELGRRKEKEAELLTFSEKLSSSNAQLQAEKTSLESQLGALQQRAVSLESSYSETRAAKQALSTELVELRELSQQKISLQMQQLSDKTTAVEQLTMTLDEEREKIIALKRKHASNIRDMQRQIQLYTKRIDQLESSNDSEIATLPIAQAHSTGMGMRSISQGSLDMTSRLSSMRPHAIEPRAISPDEDISGSPPSSSSALQPLLNSTGELFNNLDQEKTLLVQKMCQLKGKLARRDEKLEFLEGHTQQLTEDIQRKSRIIQSYILREHSGVLAPPEADAHKMKLSKKHGIMASMFTGDASKAHTGMTLELSLDINRKMQAVLEDTILKNITLKESIDTLGQEISRLTTQLKALRNSPSSRR